MKVTRVVVICMLLTVSTHAFTGDFQLLEDIGQKGKPDLRAIGFKTLRAIPADELWRDRSHRSVPNIQAIESAINKYGNETGLICLDVEHWSTSVEDPVVLKQNIDSFIDMASAVKRKFPDVQVGFYSMIPVREYLGPANGNKVRLAKWHYQNERLDVLGDAVDVVYPSLYAFDHDQDAWSRYAIANIEAARRYGKPVIVFLWPQIHGSNKWYGYDFVSGGFWERQLELVYEHADGVVIWTPHGRMRTEFDPHAAWWVVTESFARKVAVK